MNEKAYRMNLNDDSVKRFLTITEAAKITGLSVYFFRQGIKDGTVPFIRCGNKAMINYPKLVEILDNTSLNQKI